MRTARGVCRGCGHQLPEISDGGLCLWLDQEPKPQLGREPPRSRAIATEPPTYLIPIPHPVEQEALHDAGYTFDRAGQEGRLVRLEAALCRKCKAPCEAPTLLRPVVAAPLRAPWWSVLVGVGVGLWFTDLPAWVAPVPFVIGLFGVSLKHRRRVAPAAAWLDLREEHLKAAFPCRACAAVEADPIGPKSVAPCPSCGAVAVHFEITEWI